MNKLRSLSRFILLVTCALLAVSCGRQPQQVGQKPSPPAASSAGQQTLSGRVVRLADGDTITVLDANNTQHRIRLQGIDAPESHQAFGTQSKKNLSGMVFGKDVVVVYEKTDQYGRPIGKVLLDGGDINLEQIRAGMAWHNKYYEREQSVEDRELYARAEDEARSAGRGLWRDPNPVEPSDFRKEEREERKERKTRD